MPRLFSSTSVETTLASSISNSGTSMTVATGTGSSLVNGVTIGTGNQFTVAIDPDTTNEEIVFITAQSTDTFTITRGRAGSSAVSHSAGATIRHVLTSDDLDYFNTAVQPTIVDAKGDLIVATGADTLARLASSGTNNDALVVDTSTATGLKWVASSTIGAPATLKTPTGRYLMAPYSTSSFSAALTPTVNTTYFVPFYVPVSTTFDRIGIGTGTFGAGASATIRLGVYNESNGLPSTVKFDSGTISATASLTDYQITITQTLNAGIYFFALNAQARTGVAQLNAFKSGVTPLLLNSKTNLQSSSNLIQVTESATVTGGFATAGSSFTYVDINGDAAPAVGLRGA